MKALPLVAAAAMLAAGPAFAASTTAATPNDTHPMQATGQGNLRQDLQNQLSKQGFTNINIMPSSFFVQAKNSKGEPVEMVIGPDSFTEVTELPASQQHASAMTPSQHQSSATDKGATTTK